MALALYRRYRPDTFEEVIGQDQVTVPLSRALDANRLTHAYLFSGPRGCGKTSSARILARCINCEQGPTSHPCGTCASCKDLATGGPGSIDVVEIDAASHNGVDDARELRERAAFAPARDRYKVFILDEAHMVTQQGFNALLKIVEEPPKHVLFIFATTEPEKVIGTIRSRTHHYPFRLVPKEVMVPYLETICNKEGIVPQTGVLRLVMRAGGGSVRDTLSVLDQLMVGSDQGEISYDSAVALLGFTPDILIGQSVDAVIESDGEKLYEIVQKVVVGGFDPHRFVSDLLARVRDLLVLRLGGKHAEHVLSDDSDGEDMDALQRQSSSLGLASLSSMAETINGALITMAGATSPRMRLELLAARLLANRETDMVNGRSSSDNSLEPSGDYPASHLPGRKQTQERHGFAGSARRAGQGTGQTANKVNEQVPQSSRTIEEENQSVCSQPVNMGMEQGGRANASPTPSHEGVDGSMADAKAKTDPTLSPESSEPAKGNQGASELQAAVDRPKPDDNRTPDELWDTMLASLPKDVREQVSRRKVPSIALSTNQSGRARLSMTFDSALSQHAFALAVSSDPHHSGKKASAVVLAAVRQVFGQQVMIAPTKVAANGERVVATSRMAPEQLAHVKKQIALAKAGLASVGLSKAIGANIKSQPAQPKRSADEEMSDSDDPVHPATGRAGGTGAQTTQGGAGLSAPAPDLLNAANLHLPGQQKDSSKDDLSSEQAQALTQATNSSSDFDEDDPWFQPVPSTVFTGVSQRGVGSSGPTHSPQPANVMDLHEYGQDEHVEVPDPGDESDPWATVDLPKPGQSDSGNVSAPTDGPVQSLPPKQSDKSSASRPHQGEELSNAGMGNKNSPNSQAQTVQQDRDAAQSRTLVPSQEPTEPDPDDGSEYSMNDQSLDGASSMSLDQLTKFFDVTTVEEFAADDPGNPKNIKPPHKQQEH